MRASGRRLGVVIGGVAALAGLALPATSPAALPQQSGNVDLAAYSDWTIDGAAASDFTGSSISAAGDVNGDGIGDLIVGAPDADPNGRASAGTAWVIFGRRGLTQVDLSAPGIQGFRIDGPVANARTGAAVAGAGDVNRDGLADLVVAGSESYTATGITPVVAFVIFGKAATDPVDLAALGARGYAISGNFTGELTVGGGGDVNGDGAGDVVIGATGDASTTGGGWVVFGKSATANVQVASLGPAGFEIKGGALDDAAGTSVAILPDMNADGKAEIGVTSARADTINPNGGMAYVAFGRATTGLLDLFYVGTATPGLRLAPPVWNVTTGPRDVGNGMRIASAGDVNGDGIPDVLLGLRVGSHTPVSSGPGAAFVVFGRATTSLLTFAAPDAYRIQGGANDDRTGYSVAGGCDVNGDGRPDAVVGEYDRFARPSAGGALVVYGKTTTTSVGANALGAGGYEAIGAAAFDHAGSAVACTDINGDGRGDVVIGVNEADPSARSNAGSVQVLLGFGTTSVAYGPVAGVAGSAIAPVTPTVARTGTATFTVAPALPAGLALDAATGVISGTPAAAADATVTVTMTDLAGTASAAVSIHVDAAPVPPPPPPTPTIELTKAAFAATWKESSLKGTLTVRGTSTLAQRATITACRVVGKACRPAVAIVLAPKGAGAVTGTAKLRAALLPGTYRLTGASANGVVAIAKAAATVKLAGPAEGVSDRAWVSGRRTGAPATSLPRPRTEIWAHFHIAAFPSRGGYTITWRRPGGQIVGVAGKPRSVVVESSLRSSSGLQAGRWVAELRARGKVVRRAAIVLR